MAVNPNEKLTGPPLLPNPTAPVDSSVSNQSDYELPKGYGSQVDGYDTSVGTVGSVSGSTGGSGRGTVIEEPGARAAAAAGATIPDKAGQEYVAKVDSEKTATSAQMFQDAQNAEREGNPGASAMFFAADAQRQKELAGGKTTATFNKDTGQLEKVDGKPVDKKADGSYGPKAPPGGNSDGGSGASKKSDDEPAPGGKKAKYLGNHVINTEAGHKIEIDNSPGDRRIHVYHASGTFIEIQDNGLRVSKIVDNDYEYVTGNKTDVVHKDFFVHIDGDYLLRVMKKLKIEAGDIEIISHKDINLKSDGNTLQEHGGDQRVQVNGFASHRASKDRDIITGGNSTTHTLGNHFSTTVGNFTNTVNGDKYEMVGGIFYLHGNKDASISSGKDLALGAVGSVGINSETGQFTAKSVTGCQIDDQNFIQLFSYGAGPAYLGNFGSGAAGVRANGGGNAGVLAITGSAILSGGVTNIIKSNYGTTLETTTVGPAGAVSSITTGS